MIVLHTNTAAVTAEKVAADAEDSSQFRKKISQWENKQKSHREKTHFLFA
jgi:hypothetical protein